MNEFINNNAPADLMKSVSTLVQWNQEYGKNISSSGFGK
jgi:hypothetical protein